MIRRFIYQLALVLSFCAVFEEQAKAQEYPWSLQYITNMHTINPAFVGIWDNAGLMTSLKNNYTGIKGTPLSQYVGYFTPIRDQKTGVGLSLQRILIGREKRLQITGDYSYQVRLNINNFLRFGMRAGIVNYENNLLDYHLDPENIPDPQFATDVKHYYMTTFGLGAVVFSQKYFVSLSVPQVISNTFRVNRNSFSSLEDFKTVYLSGSFITNIGRNVRLRPNVLIAATAGKPLYIDVAGLIYMPYNLQFGANLRSTGSLCLSAQYSFANHVRIGFAVDYAIAQDIRKYQLGTYEVLIGYDFNISRRKFQKETYF